MTNTTKSFLILTTVLLAGMAIGGAATATFIRHNMDVILKRGPQHARDDFIHSLSKRLELNATQRATAETLSVDMHGQAQLIHEHAQQRLKVMFDDFTTKLSHVLSDSQRRELERIAKELRISSPPPPPPMLD